MTLRPITGPMGDTVLDCRVSDKLGKDLYAEIVESVKHTQLFIMSPLPSKLLVTQQQFASLNGYTEEMYQTTDRMMQTPYNVMEIDIDREYKTVESIDKVMTETEELEKEIHDVENEE